MIIYDTVSKDGVEKKTKQLKAIHDALFYSISGVLVNGTVNKYGYCLSPIGQ